MSSDRVKLLGAFGERGKSVSKAMNVLYARSSEATTRLLPCTFWSYLKPLDIQVAELALDSLDRIHGFILLQPHSGHFCGPAGSSAEFSSFLPFLIVKSTPARTWGNPADDGAVRRALAESIKLGCAPRFPRQGLVFSCAGLPNLGKVLGIMGPGVKRDRFS